MLHAKDIMTHRPISVYLGSKVTEAAQILLDQHFNGLPVVDADGRLKGILCQSDLVAQHKQLKLPSFFVILDSLIPLESPKKYLEDIQRISATLVEEAMTPNPRTVSPETPLAEIAALMVDHKHYSLPVVEKGVLVGIIGKEDLIRAMLA